MKHKALLKTLLTFLALTACLCLAPARAFAWDFKIDITQETVAYGTYTYQLYFNITDPVNHTVELTYPNTFDYPWGTYRKPLNVNLESTVEYNGITYTVTGIGERAFWFCDEIYAVNIPSTMNYIANDAFRGCNWLQYVDIYSNTIASASYTADDNLNTRFIPFFTDNSHNSIDNSHPIYYSFIGEITAIGPYALYADDYRKVNNVVFEDNNNHLTTIGEMAFYNCGMWGNLVLPGSVTSIGDGAFKRNSLEKVTFPSSVTSIGDSAFYNNSNLEKVTFEGNPASIGIDAFSGCTSLTKVNINNLGWIGIDFANPKSNPLYYAHHLYNNNTGDEITSLYLPEGVTSISRYAFYGCTSFTQATIPSSVTSIGLSAFNGCDSLIKVNTPNLADWCAIDFENANANPLTYAHHLWLRPNENMNYIVSGENFSTPSSVNYIKNHTFSGWTDLISLTVNETVTGIGIGAFEGCSNLTTVTIPSSVTAIHNRAFAGCSGMTAMTVKATTPPGITNSTFEGVDTSIPVYVPAGCGAAYRQALYWTRFTIIVETVFPEQQVEVPYLQPFEASTFPPEKWRSCLGALEGSGPYTATLTPEGGRWHFGAANGVFEGSSHAWVNIGNYEHHFWLVSPFLHLGANANMLSFDLALTRPTGNMVPITPDDQPNTRIYVLVSADNGATWTKLQAWRERDTSFNDLDGLTPESATMTYNLASYANQNVLIGFYMECDDADDASNRIHIDNFSVTSFDPTLPPTAVTVSEIAGHSAKVSWTPASPVQYKWDVFVTPTTPTEYVPGNDWSTDYLQALANQGCFYEQVTGYNQKVMTGLVSGQYYRAYVRYNDGTYTSNWVSNGSIFQTDQACALPYDIYALELTPTSAIIAWTPGQVSQTSWGTFLEDYDQGAPNTNPVIVYNPNRQFFNLEPETDYTFLVRGFCDDGDGETNYTYFDFTTPDYEPPTNIVAEPTGNHEVYFSWTLRDGSTAVDIQLSTDNFTSEIFEYNVEGNYYYCGDVDPEVTYQVRIRSIFTGNNSGWSTPVSFTMPEECVSPSQLTATNVGPFSATLNWESSAEYVDVEYREVLDEMNTTLSSNFNSANQLQTQGWTSWSNEEANWAWNQISSGQNQYKFMLSEITGTEGEHSHWLITPLIQLPGTVTFKAWGTSGERLAIYVSTSGNDHSDFHRVGTYQSITASAPRQPQTITVDLSSYLDGYEGDGYIAIVHLKFCEPLIGGANPSTFTVGIDDFTYQVPVYGAWTTLGEATENSMELTGLTPGATYQFRVRGHCDTGFSSDWSVSDSFTTVNNIVFEDGDVEDICVNNWGSDGHLTYAQAAAVESLGTVFKDNTDIVWFNELQYFTSLTEIGDNAFAGCASLQQITLPPQITRIGGYAFGNSTNSSGQPVSCSSLTQITIPDNVTLIDDHAFSKSGLMEVNLPYSVTEIRNLAFGGCDNLESVFLPSSVTTIIGNPFTGASLASIEVDNPYYDSRDNCNAIIHTATNTLVTGCMNTVIPNGVTTIGASAFENCTGLTEITLPASLESIGEFAFNNCTGLTIIHAEREEPPTLESTSFNNLNLDNITVYVPCGYLEYYQNYDNNGGPWGGFTNIIGMNCENSQVLSTGWNWWAPNIEVEAEELIDAFDGSDISGDILINSQSEGFLRRSDDGTWGGTLTSVEPGKMYKILTQESGTFTVTGSKPTTVTVNLMPGYTWFGFMSAPDNITNFVTPANGDMVLEKNGNTYTYNSSDQQWYCDDGSSTGVLTLQTNIGYIYYNATDTTKTITFSY